MKLEAKIDWEQGLAFRARLDGFDFIIDGLPEAGGRKTRAQPQGADPGSLAGCTGMDVISILGKNEGQGRSFRSGRRSAHGRGAPEKIS